MPKALRDRPSEELRQEIREALHSMIGDLLAAAQAAHAADRIGEMNLKYVRGLGQEFDSISGRLREVSETFRKANAAMEVLADRAKT